MLFRSSGDLVFLSSAAVYEGHEGLVTPDARLYPSMPYAISKLASECYIRHYHNMGRITGYLLLRLYYAYGPGEREGRLFGNLCRRVLLEHQRTFPVAGVGDSLVDPLYVEDMVDATLHALRQADSTAIYDLCGGNPRPVRELVGEVARMFDASVEVVPDRSRKEVPVHFWSDPTRAREALGLPEPLSLHEGVSRYLGWIQKAAT